MSFSRLEVYDWIDEPPSVIRAIQCVASWWSSIYEQQHARRLKSAFVLFGGDKGTLSFLAPTQTPLSLLAARKGHTGTRDPLTEAGPWVPYTQ